MNSKARTYQQSRKHPLSRNNERKVDIQETRTSGSEKVTAYVRQTSRQKKSALLQDVDRLKKRLRNEENIHRALQRAFSRPLGARPRLPPYLPLNVVKLLAEVAVLEEEVVWLEEQIVTYRQNICQESVFSCSKRKLENPKEGSGRKFSSVSTEDRIHLRKSSLSVARTASSTPDISSDQSALSLGSVASTSSAITSDKMDQISSSSSSGKQTQNERNPNADSSGPNVKVEENLMQCISNRKADDLSHRTRSSRSLMNVKMGTNVSSSPKDSLEHRKGKLGSTPYKNALLPESRTSRVKKLEQKPLLRCQPSQASVNRTQNQVPCHN